MFMKHKDEAQYGSAGRHLKLADSLYGAERYAEAVSWYRKAADQGHPFAQYLLGARYYFGEGVPRNKINAYVYWSLAGFTEDARAKLVVLEKEMTTKQLAAGQKRLIHLKKVIALKLAANQAGK
jgi:TPR repeat protein